MKMNTEEKWERTEKLIHAHQSAIAARLELGIENGTTPKHLRVGVDNSIIMLSAMQRLLQNLGLVKEDDFLDLYIELLEEEVAKDEAQLSLHFGREVKLG